MFWVQPRPYFVKAAAMKRFGNQGAIMINKNNELQRYGREGVGQLTSAADARGHGYQTRGAGVGGGIGAMLGTFVAGPVGGAIGGLLGGGLGAIIGSDYDAGGPSGDHQS